ncbi:MAG TPA: glycosyltransferase family 4 protein [Ferruginibacter sp.]|nr:glycosyltransferase family 4 protein [Ferruginibacter sp.]
MNILYICEEYPPGKIGGIGTMVNVLGRELVKQGHNVYTVGLYPHGYKQAGYEEDHGVKVWRLRYMSDRGLIRNNYSVTDLFFRRCLKYSSLLHWDTEISSKKLFTFIKKIVEQYHIDVIEMPDWNTFLHNSLTAIHVPEFNIPLVVKLHGSHSYSRKEMNNPLHKRIFRAEKNLLNRADAVSAVSQYTARETKKLFGLTKDFSVLYNSINTRLVSMTEKVDTKVIFTGTLIQSKGIHSLLTAWNLVKRRNPSVTLHVFGKGPVKELKKILDKKASDSVCFYGHVSRERLLDELATAAVAVFPSYSECFSLAPLEAMAAGCAVIYTVKSSGPELIVDGENGLLINPDDIEGIAKAINLLVEDREFRQKIAGAGKKTVSDRFDITHSVQQHIVFYNEVINEFNKKKTRSF